MFVGDAIEKEHFLVSSSNKSGIIFDLINNENCFKLKQPFFVKIKNIFMMWKIFQP